MAAALAHQIQEYNQHRRSAGEPEMTQARLAELLGVSQSAISLWSRGKRSMTAETALALADLLQCSVEDLFLPVVSRHVIPPQHDRAA